MLCAYLVKFDCCKIIYTFPPTQLNNGPLPEYTRCMAHADGYVFPTTMSIARRLIQFEDVQNFALQIASGLYIQALGSY